MGPRPVRVIDCQCHWHPRAYFEAHLGRTNYPRAEKKGSGYVFHVSSGSAFEIPSGYADLEPQLEELGGQGVDVLVSSVGAFSLDHLDTGEALDLALRLNEERAEAERRYPGLFYALAIIPMQDAEAAVKALDHAIGHLGLRGVCICSNVDGSPVDAEHLRPVYARIEELGIPIFLHPTRTVMEEKLRRFGHEYTIGLMVDSSLAALNLVFSGILDEFPELVIVHPHLGGVLPYLAARIDYEYAKPWAHGRTLERPPSDYLRERFYTDTISRNPGALALAREFYGPDRLIFSSDYPYWPASDGIAFVRAHIDREEQDSVLRGNAATLLELEPQMPRAEAASVGGGA